MGALIVAILLASLLGSFHCAGMCGAFLAIASGGVEQGLRRHAILQSAYHTGRLITYVVLGVAAGATGKLINMAGALAGLRPLAGILAGATMVIFGIAALMQTRGVQLHRLALPAAWVRVMQAGHRAAMNRPPLLRALFIGLLTTLLPCGWLYAFVTTAAGVGNPLGGAGIMAIFWIGTLPMLIAVGAGVRAILGPIGARLPAITALVLVVVGLYTLTGRTLLDPIAMAGRMQSSSVPDPNESHACCQNP